jgi:tRNA 2-thiouridine synthesizing protein A
MTEIQFAKELDCSGLSCPLPIVKTKKVISEMSSGQVLKMISTDPGSSADMASWSLRTGHEIIKSETENGKFIFYVKHK